MTGVIIKGIGGFYYVKTTKGEIIETRARGLFRKDNIKPMIGDRVRIENGSLIEIEERKNFLIRPAVANIDNLVIVSAATSPSPDFFLIDKMIVNAEIAGINPIICINKTDLASSEQIKNVYEKTPYPVVDMCARDNNAGELVKYLIGKTTAFCGMSGVGKSSILNILTDNSFETGNISDKIQRGKHTTRHVELTQLKQGGYVLDTPGFSSLEVEGIKAENLIDTFPEFQKTGCRFKGCSHINEPDCVVKEQLEKNEIAQSRYDSYCQLYNKLSKIKEWEK